MKPLVANPSLAELLDQSTVVGSLCYPEEDRIRCVACGHRCLIAEGKRGICKVRFNEEGKLKVPFGYVAGLQCDPVEKKPFFHVYPSSDALTFGMMGCDLHCSYCQNWVTSQALRDPAASAPTRAITPEQLVAIARRENARLVVSSYNEPLITAEWAVAVFEQAKADGLACAFVSNGNATPEVLDFLLPWIVAYKVDLKSFDDKHYRSLGGMLANITDSIRLIHERGIWLEVVTLVIPGFNDSEAELRDMAQFLASISRDIPWHVTAFHKDYRMTDPDATSPRALMRAAELGTEAGLRYVYAGNLPGRVGHWENTRCPGCQETLIERYGYLIRSYHLTGEGRCPRCQTAVPGIWSGDPGGVRTGNDLAAYAKRMPRPVTSSVSYPPAPSTTKSLPLVDRTPGFVPVPPSAGVSNMAALPTATVPKRAELSDDHKQRLIVAARELVRSLAFGQQPASLRDSLSPDLEKRAVAGVFVSLKRGKHLRGCCGMLGKPIPLMTALQDAAVRTVWDDGRFPSVSPSEVDHLNLEIWVLHDPEPVQATGRNRADAVTIGKHGIQVVRGQQHALFLPGVALDNHWDAETFLNQVCIKAGMFPSAWRDDATALFTFEGEVVRGAMTEPDAARRTETRRLQAVCRPEDLQRFAPFCHVNIVALRNGMTPNYYLIGAPDGNVNGVILSLQRADMDEPFHLSQISLRPGMPLQSTLFSLCQSAAQVLAQRQLTSEQMAAVQVSVAILHDPVLHGTVQDPDFAGFESSERSLMILERNKTAVVFDPARSVDDLLKEAAAAARVNQAAHAAVYSLDTLSLAPLRFSTAPQPQNGSATRLPAVAGQFYPADPAQLKNMVDTLLLTGDCKEERWPAAMVPHAGLIYSGRIAASVLKRLKIPRTVIVIGPKHTQLGMDWAVAPHQTWMIPGTSLESDPALARQLCAAIPGLELDALAHQREHGIEVELPLLARLAPQTRVVGIAIGAGDLESCRTFARGLASVLKECENQPLLLISSDMNHYATDAENRRLDGIALDAMESLDPGTFFETVTQNNISMCGVLPAVIVMETLRLLGELKKSERIGYATSAEVSGDKSRVVGYAGMLLG